jgi:hypothetical protein
MKTAKGINTYKNITFILHKDNMEIVDESDN